MYKYNYHYEIPYVLAHLPSINPYENVLKNLL